MADNTINDDTGVPLFAVLAAGFTMLTVGVPFVVYLVNTRRTAIQAREDISMLKEEVKEEREDRQKENRERQDRDIVAAEARATMVANMKSMKERQEKTYKLVEVIASGLGRSSGGY